jgi:uncharacterized OsmC-like protein
MDSRDLRALQAPLKEQYRADPAAARVTLRAQGSVDDQQIFCNVESGQKWARIGLHPLTGGSGVELCSGDLLLQALVACAGVTLRAVATALDIPLSHARVSAEGDLDVRGTLALERGVSVGFGAIRLRFDLETSATREQVDALIKLTERYCVVFQTLNQKPELSVSVQRGV